MYNVFMKSQPYISLVFLAFVFFKKIDSLKVQNLYRKSLYDKCFLAPRCYKKNTFLLINREIHLKSKAGSLSSKITDPEISEPLGPLMGRYIHNYQQVAVCI